MVSFGFDVGSTKPNTSFDPIKDGWYAMRVNKVDVSPASDGKDGRGDMLKVEFCVTDAHPEFAGRLVWENFCHMHDKQQTRNIARAQLAAIMHAIGRPDSTDTDDMLGCELRVKVATQPPKDGYDARNITKGYKALSESTDAPSPAAKPAPGAAAAPAAKQPWKR